MKIHKEGWGGLLGDGGTTFIRTACLALALALGACTTLGSLLHQKTQLELLADAQQGYLLYCAGSPADPHCQQAEQKEATDAYNTAKAAIQAYNISKSQIDYAKAKKALDDALKLFADFSK